MLSKAIDKKLATIKNDRLSLIKKIRNDIELGDYVSAFASSDILKRAWANDEETWIEILRVCVEGKDRERLMETIQEMNQLDIDWTPQGKETISSWLEGAA
jgi:hypothetical protein